MTRTDKQGSETVLKFSEHTRKRLDVLDTDLDALFTLPLSEFTGERNALAARLKKSGRGDEAVRVKAMAKPPVSAWAVNQLYWNHRQTFDQLLASGERVHKTQASGKLAEMREALNARREALKDLSELASSLLEDAGHNPSLDIIRRITSTLEAMSVYASRSDAPRAGRLTHDVDPPGFESLASWMPAATKEASGRRQVAGTAKSSSALSLTGRKVGKGDTALHREKTRKSEIAEAKASLQDAKRSLVQAQAKAQRLEAAQKRADAETRKAEKRRRDAELSLEKAKAWSEAAARRAKSIAAELEEARNALEDLEVAVEKASEELESLSR